MTQFIGTRSYALTEILRYAAMSIRRFGVIFPMQISDRYIQKLQSNG